MEDKMETDPAKDASIAGNNAPPENTPASIVPVPIPLLTPPPAPMPPATPEHTPPVIQLPASTAPQVVLPPPPAPPTFSLSPTPAGGDQSSFAIELPAGLVASAGGIVQKNQPSGTPPSSPSDLKSKDLLHWGNAVAVAQGKTGVSITTAPIAPKDGTTAIEAPFERSLKESGLKEGFPRPSQEPERGEAVEGDGTVAPRIHTYAGDMSAVMKKGVTLSSIVVAEKARVPQQAIEVPQKKSSVRWLWLLGAVLFIALGIGLIGFVVYVIQPPKTTVPSITQRYVPINSKETLALDDTTPLVKKLSSLKASENLSLGDIDEIDITKNGAPLSAEEILTALGAPNELARNATAMMVGIHSYNHNQPFLIISVSAYDRTFQGMLAWEETIANGLGGFFAPNSIDPTKNVFPPPVTFADRIVANIDVRQSQSEWPILYAFPRQNLLIVTTNESTLREILTRLTLQSKSSL